MQKTNAINRFFDVLVHHIPSVLAFDLYQHILADLTFIH
jgi:hypothetical protein